MNNQEIPVENMFSTVFSTEFFVDNSAANSSSLAAAKDRKMSSVNNGFTKKHEETLWLDNQNSITVQKQEQQKKLPFRISPWNKIKTSHPPF